MLKKLTVFICLLSFAPAAVNAQGIAAIAASPVAADSVPAQAGALPEQALDLSLPAARSEVILLAAADTSQGAATASAPEQKKSQHSSFNWGNFAEVHLGDYRWVWWVGAAAVLIAIHAGAGN
ncbi:MAG: hypothetical protein WCK54_11865 [Desulfuromonadales bacterium]